MNLFDGRLTYTPKSHANAIKAQEDYCKNQGEHDYKVKSETIGDYGVVNGTQTSHWYECAICGHVSDDPVEYESYEDDYL